MTVGESRRRHDKLHNVWSCVTVFKSRRMLWTGLVADVEVMRNEYKFIPGYEGRQYVKRLY